MASGLTKQDIYWIVNNYLGVHGGYLADFTYRSHEEFYIAAGVDRNPYAYEGTTRQRFIDILSDCTPVEQAKILRTLVAFYPVGSSDWRTPAAGERLQVMETTLAGSLVGLEAPNIDVVREALDNADTLIRAHGAAYAFDRIHTALHGFLRSLCIERPAETEPLTAIFKQLRGRIAVAEMGGGREKDIERVLSGLATVVDAVNTLRNKASLAHANERLLPEPEATLGINAMRTIFCVRERPAGHKQSRLGSVRGYLSPFDIG